MIRTLPLAVALVLLAAAAGRAATDEVHVEDVSAPAAPGRLLVKYAPSLIRSADRLLAERVRFETVTGNASLDRLNAELGVRSARPLAVARGDQAGRAATDGYFARLDAVRARFPQRAARAANATAPDLSNLYVVEIDPQVDVHEAARRYAADPAVAYAVPDYEVHATLVPNDPYLSSSGTWGQSYEDLWGLHRTSAPAAWDVATGTGVVVAVVDTGIDLTHPELQANLWTNAGEIAGNGIDDDGNGFIDDVHGWSFISNSSDPTDHHGHGTHVAGTIAAIGNNGRGVIGMSWTAKVMAVQGLNAIGFGSSSGLVSAILYAAENGADVISNSWIGFRGPVATDPISDAIATARALGAVVVAAAGNSGVDLRLAAFPATVYFPAGVEGVITVGASRADDSVAGFSNHGRGLSVSAPGVDVLSLAGADSMNVGGDLVGTDYLRLSGTSMAAPHASGVAALLLSSDPSLSTDEVRWHLELNADQLGYPGYEGQPWNPYHGWGRLNAARVFATPPVTTRLNGQILPRHAFADTVLLSGPDALALEITSLATTPWTTTAPPWLQASPSAGTAGGPLALTYDTSGLSPGPYSGSLAVAVPSAVDGGAGMAASVYVHRDERLGPEMVLDSGGASVTADPKTVSTGLGSLVVWGGYHGSVNAVMAAVIDAAGNSSGAYAIADDRPEVPERIELATDGHGYLVVWSERVRSGGARFRVLNVYLVRVDALGQALDVAPILLSSKNEKRAARLAGVGFDGQAYTVVLAEGFPIPDNSLLRIGRDGAIWDKPRPIGRYGSSAERFACAQGSCLLAWSEIDGTTPGNFYNYAVRSVQIVGTHVVNDVPQAGASKFYFPSDLVSNGSDFLLVGQQHLLCPAGSGETICREDVVAARLSPAGFPFDAEAFTVNVDSPLDTPDVKPIRFIVPGAAVFDGSQYLLPFALVQYSYTGAPKTIFLARLRPDGTLVDGEEEGLLIRPQWANVSPPEIAVDATRSFVVASEHHDSGGDAIFAIPVLGRPASAAFVPAPIGSIGARTVGEGAFLRLALAAPGLDPGSTIFSAVGVPEGAHLDAATGLLSWRPHGGQRGAYVVQFAAADASAQVSENVTLTVSEASLSIRGTARLGGSGVPSLAVTLTGGAPRRRTGYTDGQGRFRFDDLTAGGSYRLSLKSPSNRTYRLISAPARITLTGADVADADLTVVPK